MTTCSPLLIDVAGLELTEADRRRLAHPLIGGVIHFARNWHSRAQLTALNAEIKAIRPDLLICVDHEGGRVQRFRSDGFTHLPAMRALGQRWAQGRGDPAARALAAIDAATACGYVLAAELRACGVDLSFTPVLDLDHGGSTVIGDRAFHRDPRVVSLLARGLMHGLRLAGMANCGKHFPGHGWVVADSHTDQPVDRRGLRAILSDDAAPYGWLALALDAVMPAHVVFSRLDPRPAGYSPRWLREVLREQMGFVGAIISDDLSMAGARSLGGHTLSHTEAAVQALQAGCDLLLLCNQSTQDGGAAIDAVLDGLTHAQHTGRWQPDPDSEARRLALLPTQEPTPWDELMTEARYRAALQRLGG